MSWLNNLLTIVQVLTALGVIVLVLLQHGKGADMGAAFGGGASGSLFGATGSANFLSRVTAVLAALFFLSTLGLAMFAHQRPQAPSSIMDVAPPAPSTAPDVPAPPSDVPPPSSGAASGAATPAAAGGAPAAAGGSAGSAAPAAPGASTAPAGDAAVPKNEAAGTNPK
ncbi:MAG: preprotein translocase subunit SecG [Burkholderiaceae bacterium]